MEIYRRGTVVFPEFRLKIGSVYKGSENYYMVIETPDGYSLVNLYTGRTFANSRTLGDLDNRFPDLKQVGSRLETNE